MPVSLILNAHSVEVFSSLTDTLPPSGVYFKALPIKLWIMESILFLSIQAFSGWGVPTKVI